ncbi:probable peptidyl-tRNA hydrolase 2 [Planococcus citri]|uniref:probable peptidyl-tRNA hydrolase 2 n=1 Tax=Planococcus citri TaxID=170843 RepID=UPI0031FA1B7A
MLDTLISNKCFIVSFGAGFIGTVVFLYFFENHSKPPKDEPAESKPKPLRPKKVSGECKMVLVVRKDVKATKREIAAYCVNACFEAYKRSLEKYPKLVKHWEWNGSAKIALKVNNEAELIAIKKKADEQDIINHMVLSENQSLKSALVLALGPDILPQINSVTGHLKLY